MYSFVTIVDFGVTSVRLDVGTLSSDGVWIVMGICGGAVHCVGRLGVCGVIVDVGVR